MYATIKYFAVSHIRAQDLRLLIISPVFLTRAGLQSIGADPDAYAGENGKPKEGKCRAHS